MNIGDTAYGSRRGGRDDEDVLRRFAYARSPYASPSVSNIAALMASGADLPAHTTNWNAGK